MVFTHFLSCLPSQLKNDPTQKKTAAVKPLHGLFEELTLNNSFTRIYDGK